MTRDRSETTEINEQDIRYCQCGKRCHKDAVRRIWTARGVYLGIFCPACYQVLKEDPDQEDQQEIKFK